MSHNILNWIKSKINYACEKMSETDVLFLFEQFVVLDCIERSMVVL